MKLFSKRWGSFLNVYTALWDWTIFIWMDIKKISKEQFSDAFRWRVKKWTTIYSPNANLVNWCLKKFQLWGFCEITTIRNVVFNQKQLVNINKIWTKIDKIYLNGKCPQRVYFKIHLRQVFFAISNGSLLFIKLNFLFYKILCYFCFKIENLFEVSFSRRL